MRQVAVLLGFALVLSGCDSEPDFDERFEAAQAEIEEKAESIENDLEAADARSADKADKSGPDKANGEVVPDPVS
ncbi:hypothetical protein HME9302_02505 [Alteripontixanthobacter maritimus]|uniref:Uncharacterized protein n=1 Tax=Alteripontixanthobacter maritimus TaxID=2161824 RepID=A0A369Q998_9SPHN|nr:hypothetical protein [Alteripontixanthobacter maritimus]RDC61284.1 hypothetical protein HME9302_02505 [Alteripontixanthobacter maritimus]